MVAFTLPKNSRINGRGKTHFAETKGRLRTFKVYRFDPESGENPRYDTF